MTGGKGEATPRPWKLKAQKNSGMFQMPPFLVSKDGLTPIAVMGAGKIVYSNAEENGALIVEAVNNYSSLQTELSETRQRMEDLEESLTLALPFVETALEDKGYKPGVVDRMTKQIRSVLELAKEG